MASSFSKGFAPSTNRSPLYLVSESLSSFSERRLGLHRNLQSLSWLPLTRSIPPCKSSHDDHTGPLTSRSSNGTSICSFVIAATTAVGLSICAPACFAMAMELEVNDSTVLSVASIQTNPNIQLVSQEDQKVTLVFNRSDSSQPDYDVSLSMAIPIPHEKVWADVQKGFVSPSPLIREHALQQLREAAMASVEGSALHCPRWTPRDLEMVLPDFHGRPKPFPHQGHHWSASFMTRETDGEAFLQIFTADDELQLNEIRKTDGKTNTILIKDNTDKMQSEGKLSPLKVLGTEKFTCFSM